MKKPGAAQDVLLDGLLGGLRGYDSAYVALGCRGAGRHPVNKSIKGQSAVSRASGCSMVEVCPGSGMRHRLTSVGRPTGTWKRSVEEANGIPRPVSIITQRQYREP